LVLRNCAGKGVWAVKPQVRGAFDVPPRLIIFVTSSSCSWAFQLDGGIVATTFEFLVHWAWKPVAFWPVVV
jgi:hypothetical protein